MITASEAQARGRRDCKEGKGFEHNPYIHIPDSGKSLHLQAWWRTGYLKEQVKLEVVVHAEDTR